MRSARFECLASSVWRQMGVGNPNAHCLPHLWQLPSIGASLDTHVINHPLEGPDKAKHDEIWDARPGPQALWIYGEFHAAHVNDFYSITAYSNLGDYIDKELQCIVSMVLWSDIRKHEQPQTRCFCHWSFSFLPWHWHLNKTVRPVPIMNLSKCPTAFNSIVVGSPNIICLV